MTSQRDSQAIDFYDSVLVGLMGGGGGGGGGGKGIPQIYN